MCMRMNVGICECSVMSASQPAYELAHKGVN